MKKYLSVLLMLSAFFSVKSYAQITVPISDDLNQNTMSVDEDAMNWELSYNFMGTDEGAGQATCTSDVIPPEIFCPQNIITQGTSTNCGVVVNFSISVNDNCPGWTAQCEPPSGTTFTAGTTTVTCTATDASNNTADCMFDVTVIDNQPPSIYCPDYITASTDPGMCSAVVALPAPSGGDNCGEVSIQYDAPPGNIFPVGGTNVTCTVTDPSGNMSSCSFYVIVLDNEPAQIVCPDDIEVSPNPNTCDAVVTWPPIITDNCSSSLMAICDTPSGSTFPVGTTPVVCLITDASTTISCQFDVTVTNDCFANCPPTINLNNTTVNGLYHAENSVTADNTITSGSDVNFKAGDVIELSNEFIAPANTNFSAEIENCTTGDQN